MTALKKRIKALIDTTGPVSVAHYMALCLFDPEHGYYMTREPFGVGGDFTTAPEVSQMFGELCAVWLYTAWQTAGRPDKSIFAEIGPGRGTLMKDMLRTLAKLDKAFLSGTDFHLIETSPRLVEVQKKILADAPVMPSWVPRIADLPDAPLFIIGNELFDAIPIHQYVKTPKGWRERVIGLDERGELTFLAGPGVPDPTLLPPGAEASPAGAIVEIAPARTALMDDIAARMAKRAGAGLFIDYGYAEPAIGDTLQAMRRHAYTDILAEPGEADLTAHVDFAALAQVARSHGLAAGLLTQGDFLLAQGLIERAGRLGANKNPSEQNAIREAVERLAGPNAMGTLFKVLAIMPGDTAVPPFPHER